MSTPTYWDYLQIPTLLDLQQGLGDEPGPDELHFIIVHQAYELWFKLALVQIRLARNHLAEPEVPEEQIPQVCHHLARVNEILQLAVKAFDVMETLTPLDFLDFRDKLVPSSGFQSFQMREIEMVLGLDEAQRLTYGKVHPLDHIRKLAETSPGGAMAWGRLLAAQEETSLRTALHRWLYRTPIQGSQPGDPGDDAVVDEFLANYLAKGRVAREELLQRLLAVSDDPDALRKRFQGTEASAEAFLQGTDVDEGDRARLRRVRAALLFIESYRELPLLAWPRLLIDRIVELEQLLVLWRTRHARMVERLIGRRVGTGGSSGVDYLDRTTKYRVFPELWAVRSMLSPRRAHPDLLEPSAYGFKD